MLRIFVILNDWSFLCDLENFLVTRLAVFWENYNEWLRHADTFGDSIYKLMGEIDKECNEEFIPIVAWHKIKADYIRITKIKTLVANDIEICLDLPKN